MTNVGNNCYRKCVIKCGALWETEDLGADCGDSFHCEESKICIDSNQVCNFHTDCPLGEDEGFICGEDLFFICNKLTGCRKVLLLFDRNCVLDFLHETREASCCSLEWETI